MVTEVVSVATINLMGNQRVMNAHLLIDGQQATVSAHGSQTGKPGYVRVTVAGIEVPVLRPERFGHAFNEEWFRKYLEANIK